MAATITTCWASLAKVMELYQVQQLLEGEEMNMRDYLRRVYPDKTIRTVDRKRENFNQISSIPPGVMKRLGSVQLDVLSKFERITNAALGDIRNAIKELPQLPASTDKDAEVYLEKLDTKIAENRALKHKGTYCERTSARPRSRHLTPSSLT